MSRKSRGRSISEPAELPSSVRRKSDVEEGMIPEQDSQQTWTEDANGTIPEGAGSEMSDSEANLSEYEDQIRRNRELPPVNEASGKTSSIPIASSRLRKASFGTTPVVSPRQEILFLDDEDYGIQLEDPDEHKPADFLMTHDIISKLHSGLPSRWRIANTWTLLYSTNFHGYSLSTMISRSKGFNGPTMAIIRDTEGGTFGAFTTEPFHPRIGHFGTGECFLWKLVDGRVRRFKSTGLNDYFMMCESGFIAVGCGDGKFGLWIDSQFEHGHSHTVPTFNNDPLSSSENFECVSFELWGLLCDES